MQGVNTKWTDQRVTCNRLPWVLGPFCILMYSILTYSEKESDKYKYSWEVCCCPSVVPTLSTTSIHATEQLKNKFTIGLQATPKTTSVSVYSYLALGWLHMKLFNTCQGIDMFMHVTRSYSGNKVTLCTRQSRWEFTVSH